jgi:hypothetical protein
MSHRDAPLPPEGRRRLVDRCRELSHRPCRRRDGNLARLRIEVGQPLRRHGDLGLLDRSSAPHRQLTATDADVVARIEDLRRTYKWSAARIAFELNNDGATISRRTVSRHACPPSTDEALRISPPAAQVLARHAHLDSPRWDRRGGYTDGESGGRRCAGWRGEQLPMAYLTNDHLAGSWDQERGQGSASTQNCRLAGYGERAGRRLPGYRCTRL